MKSEEELFNKTKTMHSLNLNAFFLQHMQSVIVLFSPIVSILLLIVVVSLHFILLYICCCQGDEDDASLTAGQCLEAMCTLLRSSQHVRVKRQIYIISQYRLFIA